MTGHSSLLKNPRHGGGRYDTADHVANLRAIGVTLHAAHNQAVTKTGQDTAPVPLTNEPAASCRWDCPTMLGDGRVYLRMGQAAWTMRRPSIAASLALLPYFRSVIRL